MMETLILILRIQITILPKEVQLPILLIGNAAISATSIVDTFNSYFASNSIGVEASMTSAGKLELRSTESGSDTKISISGAGATAGLVANSQSAMVAVQFINGQNDTGSGGNAAVFNGQTNDSAQTVGFGLSGHFAFSLTDKAGASLEQ